MRAVPSTCGMILSRKLGASRDALNGMRCGPASNRYQRQLFSGKNQAAVFTIEGLEYCLRHWCHVTIQYSDHCTYHMRGDQVSNRGQRGYRPSGVWEAAIIHLADSHGAARGAMRVRGTWC